MTQRLHMTKNGPKPCDAKSIETCRAEPIDGMPAEHFDDPQKANAAWEKMNKDKEMGTSLKKNPNARSYTEVQSLIDNRNDRYASKRAAEVSYSKKEYEERVRIVRGETNASAGKRLETAKELLTHMAKTDRRHYVIRPDEMNRIIGQIRGAQTAKDVKEVAKEYEHMVQHGLMRQQMRNESEDSVPANSTRYNAKTINEVFHDEETKKKYISEMLYGYTESYGEKTYDKIQTPDGRMQIMDIYGSSSVQSPTKKVTILFNVNGDYFTINQDPTTKKWSDVEKYDL